METINQQENPPTSVNMNEVVKNIAESICYRFKMELPKTYLIENKVYAIGDVSDALVASGQAWKKNALDILQENTHK